MLLHRFNPEQVPVTHCCLSAPWVLAAVGPVAILVPVAILLILLAAISLYNGLVRARNHCDESWSDVDTELKRRYDLIPNLVEVVKGYAKHEASTLERVIQARNSALNNHGSPEAQARDENKMIGELHNLFALAEDYPELKASKHFTALQEELITTENRIQRARRFYNGNVRLLANRIETFPSNVLASMYGFRPREFFEIRDSSQREAPPMSLP